MAFSFKSKKTLFSATEKKASFGLEKLILCFPVRFCVRDKLRAEVQTFWKTQDFVTFLAASCLMLVTEFRSPALFSLTRL